MRKAAHWVPVATEVIGREQELAELTAFLADVDGLIFSEFRMSQRRKPAGGGTRRSRQWRISTFPEHLVLVQPCRDDFREQLAGLGTYPSRKAIVARTELQQGRQPRTARGVTLDQGREHRAHARD